jgi:hypothetical protein
MKDPKEEAASRSADQLDRRSFVKFIPAMGAAGFVAANLPATALAQTPSPSPTPLPSPSPSPTPAQPSPLAKAYEEVARVRFGKHVKDDQWERIGRDLEGNVRAADRLRESKLKNGDEPDFTFTA